MNRRFGWITPHILSKISIKLDTYAPYVSDGSGFVGQFKSDPTASYGDLTSTYGYKGTSHTFEKNNISLQLNYFDIDNGGAVDLSTYFTGKKLFKILDIYLENSYNSDPGGASGGLVAGSLKIYYLEKK